MKPKTLMERKQRCYCRIW